MDNHASMVTVRKAGEQVGRQRDVSSAGAIQNHMTTAVEGRRAIQVPSAPPIESCTVLPLVSLKL